MHLKHPEWSLVVVVVIVVVIETGNWGDWVFDYDYDNDYEGRETGVYASMVSSHADTLIYLSLADEV